MKNQLLLLLFGGLLAFTMTNCQSGPAESSASGAPDTTATAPEADPRLDFTIVPGERVGLVDLNTATEADVLQAYGNLAGRDSIHLGEGMFEPGIILFKGTKNQVELYWNAATGTDRPGYVSIYGEDGQTDWATANGITIGTTLKEVERINGRPFELYGFGWDYGGYVSNWNGGTLENKGVSIRFEPSDGAGTPIELVGDVTFNSDNPALAEVEVMVSELSLRSSRPSPMEMMQGDWASATDEGYEIIIEGNQMRHYNNQRLTYTTTIQVDPGCQSEACAVTGTAPEGFCFIEEDESDAQCNLLITADATTLEYTAIGAAGGSLVFKRVD